MASVRRFFMPTRANSEGESEKVVGTGQTILGYVLIH